MATIEFTSALGETIVFAGSPTEMADSVNYFGYGFTSNDDWYTVGDSKSDLDERPVADGAFGILRDWRPSLPLEFLGWYRGPDRASVRAARRYLQKVIGNGSEVTMKFVDEDESTSRGVSIRSMVPSNDSGLYFRVTVDAVALDPDAYSDAQIFTTGVPVSGGGLLFPLGTNRSSGAVDASAPYWDFGADGTSGRLTITNDGTTETYPVLSASGGLAGGFSATDVTTGETVTLSRQIPVGSTVVIDQRTGTAIIDGQGDVSGFITSYGFFSIGPGETHVIQFSPIGAVTGTPQFQLTEQDAFI